MNVLNCLVVNDEIESIYDDQAIDSLCSIKCENIEIKYEECYTDTPFQNLKDEPFDWTSGCSNTSFLRDCMDVKEEIKDIYDDSTIENISSIKCEDVEIKAEQNYSGTPLLNLGDKPVNCTSGSQFECVKTTNNAMLQGERKRDESKDNCHELEQGNNSEERIYKCDCCNYETNRKKNLGQHQLMHKNIPEEQMYKCGWCDYKTYRLKYLTQHQQTHQYIPKEQMYKCGWCDYEARRKKYLIQHQIKHKDIPEEQMYKCSWCEYKTGRKSYLVWHELRHNNIPEERIYKCGSCDYETVYKSNFTKHQLRHKNIPEEQMYKCDSCEFKTVYKSSLKKHRLRRHKNIH